MRHGWAARTPPLGLGRRERVAVGRHIFHLYLSRFCFGKGTKTHKRVSVCWRNIDGVSPSMNAAGRVHRPYLSSIGAPPPGVSRAAIAYAAQYAVPKGTASVVLQTTPSTTLSRRLAPCSYRARSLARSSSSSATTRTSSNVGRVSSRSHSFSRPRMNPLHPSIRRSVPRRRRSRTRAARASSRLAIRREPVVARLESRPRSKRPPRFVAHHRVRAVHAPERPRRSGTGSRRCNALVRLRYASLISSGAASDLTPSTSYGSASRAARGGCARRRAPRARRNDTEIGAPADATHGRSGRSMARARRPTMCDSWQ